MDFISVFYKIFLFFNGIKSSYEKINSSIDGALISGYSKINTFLKIHIPYLSTNIILIILLISEVIKELPMTMTQTFNFETFATEYMHPKIYLKRCITISIFWSTILILLSSRYILSKKINIIG